MIDKFKQLFGPNSNLGGTQTEQDSGVRRMADSEGDLVLQRQVTRVRVRRRMLGFAVLLAAALVIVPGVFEPDETFADRGASVAIPPVTEDLARHTVTLQSPAADDETNPSIADVLPATPVAPKTIGRRATDSEQPEDVLAGFMPTASEAAKPAAKTASASHAPAASGAASAQTKPTMKVTPVAPQAKSAPRTVVHAAPAVVKPREPVRIEHPEIKATKKIEASGTGRYFIQVIATANEAAAEKRAQRLRNLGLPSYTEKVQRRGSDLWRVRVGRFETMDEAKAALDVLALNTIDNGGVNAEPAKKHK